MTTRRSGEGAKVPNILAQRLREQRKAWRYTLKSAGEAVGTNGSTLGNWEHGVQQPSFDMLLRLARLYGVSADYLVGADTHVSAGGGASISGDVAQLFGTLDWEVLPEHEKEIVRTVIRTITDRYKT